jgi:ABC-type microcin C transport system permease subunit YejE
MSFFKHLYQKAAWVSSNISTKKQHEFLQTSLPKSSMSFFEHLYQKAAWVFFCSIRETCFLYLILLCFNLVLISDKWHKLSRF